MPAREQTLDSLAYWLRDVFHIIMMFGALIVLFPIVAALLFWLVAWPLAGFINMEAAVGVPAAHTESVHQFQHLWARAIAFVVIYGAVGWLLRAWVLQERKSPRAGDHDEMATRQAGRALSLSWPTFWFAVVAVAVGSLAASAVRAVLPDVRDSLAAASPTIIIPVSRVAVAAALVTTALEWWAESWQQRRAAAAQEVDPGAPPARH